MAEEQKQGEKKPAPTMAVRQSMTAEKAKELGLDPTPYGKPAAKK